MTTERREWEHTSSSEREGRAFIKFNFMEVKDMREFIIAIMLVAVPLLAGGTQLVAEEEDQKQEETEHSS